MRKRVKIIGVICLLTIMIFNINILSTNLKTNSINLFSLKNANAVGIEIDIDWSDHVCRCHNNICQDGNMISFRPQCAYISPGHSSDVTCQLVKPNC